MVSPCGMGAVGSVGGAVAAAGDGVEDGAVACAVFSVLFLYGILAAGIMGQQKGGRL